MLTAYDEQNYSQKFAPIKNYYYLCTRKQARAVTRVAMGLTVTQLAYALRWFDPHSQQKTFPIGASFLL